MNFKQIDIQKCYETGTHDLVADFYSPVLSAAVSYDRIAGFFSSSALAIVAEGLADFIRNKGKMRLITSPRLQQEDIDEISKILEEGGNPMSKIDLDIDNIEDEIEKDHVKALGWMLQEGLLEIKLALVYDKNDDLCGEKEIKESGLFHQKVGILKDLDGNLLSFSGSINESASAWANNDEEFKVFKQWEEPEYFDKDNKRFNELWYNKRKNVAVFDFPTALKEKLITYSKDFDIERISLKNYQQYRIKHKSFSKIKEIPLFHYQSDALELWRNNHYHLMFEMATGTGKTRTAIAGIKHLYQKEERLVTIISTPQNTLTKQWSTELKKLDLKSDIEVLADSTNLKWESQVKTLLLQNVVGLANHCIIYTTHATASSDKFLQIIEKYGEDNNFLFIGDEVHWLGAPKLRKALKPQYKYRIGLSATPSRWFDDSGTAILVQYFGDKRFEFTIRDALTEFNPLTNKHYLVNYHYNIFRTSLSESETDEYKSLTVSMSKLYRLKDKNMDAEEQYNRLLLKRSNIIKNAENKMSIFESILDELQKDGVLQNLLIFVSPQQKDIVKSIMATRGIIFQQLTEEEGTKKEKRFGGLSEREHIIQEFKNNEYQAIVAIKCLDEGIDIPSACRGILLSSSTNPREYVQRIGRIIRQDNNKTFAELYDICVDSVHGFDQETQEMENRIREKEKIRLSEIAENAINSADALYVINSLN